MGLASILSLTFAVVALCSVMFNGWIYKIRRKEPAHLWLATSSMGIAGMSTCTALLYEAASSAEAARIHQVFFLFSAPLALGFLRFSFSLLRLEKPFIDWAVRTVGYSVFVLALIPGSISAGRAVVIEVGWLGLSYWQPQLTPIGIGCVAAYLGLFSYVVGLFFRHADRIENNRGSLRYLVALFAITGLNDALVGLKLYEAPLLLGIGYTAFLVSFTAILVRRMVESMSEVERHALTLSELVEERTAELRQKELQLAHGERMSVIGTLAAGVAHEINNPIAFVSSNLNQLEELWDKAEDASEVPEILEECREGVTRIGDIVSGLLSLARRSDGQDESVDLTKVVESTVPLIRRELDYYSSLRVQLSAVPAVQGDPRLLGQVVLNLLLNAVQAPPAAGELGKRITVSTRPDGEFVNLNVHDTGAGIRDDVLPRVFDPFFTTKKSSEGTGLGLAVTHQIVERHRGQIAIETGDDGTTVTVRLPRSP